MYWFMINSYDRSVTVKVTGVPAGVAGARYPWECKGHDHDRQSYYIDGAESGPVARWLGDGVGRFGFQVGQEVDKDTYMIMYGDLMDPARHAELTAQAEQEIRDLGLTGDDAKAHYAELLEGARLGRAPRQFKSVEDRFDERLREEPDADEARQADILREVKRSQKQANGSFDVTFSPQKSISLYRAGLLAQGRGEDAAKVEAAHRAGVTAAVEFLQREAGFSRVGYHGTAGGPDLPSVGRYVDAHEWTVAEFLHETSRAGDPQMHSHSMLLNRVPVIDESGATKWLTLDSRALHKMKKGAEAVYHRTMEEHLVRDLPVEMTTREDGKAREVIGITLEDRGGASKRRLQITGELEKYVDLYKQRTGHDPSPRTLSQMAEKATLKTRDRKDDPVPMEEMVDRWERQAQAEDRRTHAEMVDSAEAAAVGVRLERMYEAAPELDRAEVIRTALAEVQSERAYFGREDVMRSIGRALPDQLGEAAADVGGVRALLESLTDEALTGANDVVQVTGFELIETPPELRRESDGRSIYQPGRSERYATLSQMSAEEKMVATASRTDAPRLASEQIEAAIERSTLGDDQAAAVRGVLGDGRQVSVIVGPAGTGKSYAQGVISKAWEDSGTGRVIGLAPSNVAAAVLAEAGIETTASITKFLNAQQGRGTREALDKLTLRAGDLVVVDEAAMANHPHMSSLVEIVTQAGAKMAAVGDDAQMQSVGVGGGFRLLRDEIGAYELSTVRRFRDSEGQVRQWEADASLQLRDGDPAALAAYEEHGRLLGGTQEEMSGAAVRAYVADVVDGRQPVLVTPTNETADELSSRIRAELVRLGRVEEGGALVMGGNVAGQGDLIQTRENEPTLVDSAGLPVINRRMYKVQQLHRDGSLTVQHVAGRGEDGAERLGGTVRLGPEYVAENVVLGYAGTVHATQGRTVDRGYLYGDEGVSREAAYVALTRGTELNVAFLVTQREPDDTNLRGLDSTTIGQMARILERETTDRSAVEMLRAGLDYSESLRTLVPIWADVTGRHTREECRDLLATMLGPDSVARLDAEHADPLYRHLRERQLQGHDIEALLRDAIGNPRSLTDARELGALLQHRVEQAAQRRTPEREPAGADWAARTPDSLDGQLGDFAREVAEAVQARQEHLGRQVAEGTPQWALDRLGELPEEELERAGWEHRAGIVAAYQEMYDVEGAGTVIGQAPPRGAVEQRAAWEAAYEALGRPDEHRHIAGASDEQLRRMVDGFQREQQWAPSYVGERMAEAYQESREYEQRAALAEAEAATLAAGEARAELEDRAAGLRELAVNYADQARSFEEIHEIRQLWQGDTEQIREAAQAAAAELDRRQVDQQTPTRHEVTSEEVPLDWGDVERHDPEREADLDERDAATPAYEDVQRDDGQREPTVALDWSDIERNDPEREETLDQADAAAPVPEVAQREPATEIEGQPQQVIEREAQAELEDQEPEALFAEREEVQREEGQREPTVELDWSDVERDDAERREVDPGERDVAAVEREDVPQEPGVQLDWSDVEPETRQESQRETADGRQVEQEPATSAEPVQKPTLQDELHAARAYLERRTEQQAAGRVEVAEQAEQQATAREEQAHRESARVMAERQSEQEISRGIER